MIHSGLVPETIQIFSLREKNENKYYNMSELKEETNVIGPVDNLAIKNVEQEVNEVVNDMVQKIFDNAIKNAKSKEELDLEEKRKIGIEAHEFILETSKDQNLRDFECGICRCLINSAVELRGCGHVFCQGCIYEAYEHNDKCPLCKIEIDDEDMVESKFVDRKIGQINVECPFCNWKGNYLDFVRKHSEPTDENPCPYIIVHCDDCYERVKHESVSQHKKEACVHRYIPCDKCNGQIKFNKIQDHLNNHCIESMVQCPNENCEFIGKRNEYTDHKDICEHEMILCPLHTWGCTKVMRREDADKHIENAVQTHFMIAEERINDLEIENRNLKTKLLNYEPIDPNYPLKIGTMLKYKERRHWHVCIIINIEDDGELELEIQETEETISVHRNSDRLRLLV